MSSCAPLEDAPEAAGSYFIQNPPGVAAADPGGLAPY